MLEVGCGVGNFLFPLIEDDPNLFVYACDFSPRAVQFVKVIFSHLKQIVVVYTSYNAQRQVLLICDLLKDKSGNGTSQETM